MKHKLSLRLVRLFLLAIFFGYTTCALAGWTYMEAGINNDLYDVWGSSATDVFIVGTLGSVLHYDGNPEGTWTDMEHRGH